MLIIDKQITSNMSKKVNKLSKIFVAGPGLVGSAIVRRLKLHGYKNILTISKKTRSKKSKNVEKYFKK